MYFTKNKGISIFYKKYKKSVFVHNPTAIITFGKVKLCTKILFTVIRDDKDPFMCFTKNKGIPIFYKKQKSILVIHNNAPNLWFFSLQRLGLVYQIFTSYH